MFTERKKRRKQMMLAQQNGEVPDFNDNDEDEEKLKFEMPQFGNSPGPTPVQTPSGSRPTTPDDTAEQEVFSPCYKYTISYQNDSIIDH